MRSAFLLIFLAGPAAAHPGHLAQAAGHAHWVAGAAIAVAIGLGLWAAFGTGGARPKPVEPEADGSEDGEKAGT